MIVFFYSRRMFCSYYCQYLVIVRACLFSLFLTLLNNVVCKLLLCFVLFFFRILSLFVFWSVALWFEHVVQRSLFFSVFFLFLLVFFELLFLRAGSLCISFSLALLLLCQSYYSILVFIH